MNKVMASEVRCPDGHGAMVLEPVIYAMQGVTKREVQAGDTVHSHLDALPTGYTLRVFACRTCGLLKMYDDTFVHETD